MHKSKTSAKRVTKQTQAHAKPVTRASKRALNTAARLAVSKKTQRVAKKLTVAPISITSRRSHGHGHGHDNHRVPLDAHGDLLGNNDNPTEGNEWNMYQIEIDREKAMVLQGKTPKDRATLNFAPDASKVPVVPTYRSHSKAAIQMQSYREETEFPVSKRIVGPPGTVEEPTMVFSPKPYRVVGCVGLPDLPHPPAWFSMEGYIKHMCPHCAQVFQLTNNPDECNWDYIEKQDPMARFHDNH